MPRSSAAAEGPRSFTVQELADESGVSVASIKLYVREGLLPRGDGTRPKRAYYDERHLRRLRVIRTLRDLAGISLADMRRAFEAVERADTDAVDVIAPIIDILSGAREDGAGAAAPEALAEALRDVDAAFGARGLTVRDDAGSRAMIARAAAAARAVGIDFDAAALGAYLDALRPLAELEVHHAKNAPLLRDDKEGALELAILGTVLGEPILVGLRRALHEHFTTTLLRPGKPRRPARRRP